MILPIYSNDKVPRVLGIKDWGSYKSDVDVRNMNIGIFFDLLDVFFQCIIIISLLKYLISQLININTIYNCSYEFII